MLPTFIMIGPGRSATTMLYEAFREHPDICMAKNTKETNFFTSEFHRGVKWYESFYEHCGCKPARGEVCNLYIYDPDAPQRIAEVIPDVKLIACLRNPFDRMYSVFLYRQRSGTIPANIGFSEAIRQYPDLVTDNLYGDQLERYLACFPSANILITFYDDLEKDAVQFIKTIFDFIEVDSNFIPKAIHERINPSASVRSSYLAPIIRFMADALRQLQLFHLLDKAKRDPVIRRLLFEKPTPTEMQTTHQIPLTDEVKDLLNSQIQKVKALTGKEPSNWYKS